jgi:hypothetical protein
VFSFIANRKGGNSCGLQDCESEDYYILEFNVAETGKYYQCFGEKLCLLPWEVRNYTPSLKYKAAYSTEHFLLLYQTI